jgi:hypothetical protein
VRLAIGTPIPTAGLDYAARAELADQSRAVLLALGAKQ